MQGERFNPELEPVGSRLRSIELNNTFGYEGDTHSSLALTAIMNSFPRAVAKNGRPYPIKCDIFKARHATDIAFATIRNDCYWVLFGDEFIRSCAGNGRLFAEVISKLEPSLFAGTSIDSLSAIIRDMTMEIVVQHELCHLKQGHVDIAVRGGGLGLAEAKPTGSLLDRLGHKIPASTFRQRSMEFVADEAGIGAATIGSGLGRWILVQPEAKSHFDTRTLALAAYVGMLALTIELSPIESSDAYPSKSARLFHFHDLFGQYVRTAANDSRMGFLVDPARLVEESHIALEVLKEGADRGMLGHRCERFKVAVAPMFSQAEHDHARRECNEIASECREDLQKWLPFKGEYVEWQEYVRFERMHGRNPIGLPPVD